MATSFMGLYVAHLDSALPNQRLTRLFAVYLLVNEQSNRRRHCRNCNGSAPPTCRAYSTRLPVCRTTPNRKQCDSSCAGGCKYSPALTA
eukprot:10801-Eustigmatos_ZCMA.PRE.1